MIPYRIGHLTPLVKIKTKPAANRPALTACPGIPLFA
jgi:hypothetical protein